MRTNLMICLTSAAAIVILLHHSKPSQANPIRYDMPQMSPMSPMSPMPMYHPVAPPMMPAPVMMGSHMDPYAMPYPNQYYMMPQYMPMPFDAARRAQSVGGQHRNHHDRDRHSSKQNDPNDDEKAMSDIPGESDAPSSITEKLSDSFSALGEGVRNHFKSMSENFSDTVDDIKEAWKPSDNTKKRG